MPHVASALLPYADCRYFDSAPLRQALRYFSAAPALMLLI